MEPIRYGPEMKVMVLAATLALSFVGMSQAQEAPFMGYGPGPDSCSTWPSGIAADSQAAELANWGARQE
jgi:hypothetical protein